MVVFHNGKYITGLLVARTGPGRKGGTGGVECGDWDEERVRASRTLFSQWPHIMPVMVNRREVSLCDESMI